MPVYKKVAAIHRGFYFSGEKVYNATGHSGRSLLILKLRCKHSDDHDPSHICGRRICLEKLLKQAIDLDFNGLMIESHIQPDEAWSDDAK